VTLVLDHDVDISRGDMIVSATDEPLETRNLQATVCWMADRPLDTSVKYFLKHTSRTTRALVRSVDHRIDINALETDETGGPLEKNDIGRIQIQTLQPIFCDAYRTNRDMGAFILIDPETHDTMACGMIELSRDGMAMNL
jgi:sulfate adenylyltransferase subunit 1 (EFTu-like GTPase family)